MRVRRVFSGFCLGLLVGCSPADGVSWSPPAPRDENGCLIVSDFHYLSVETSTSSGVYGISVENDEEAYLGFFGRMTEATLWDCRFSMTQEYVERVEGIATGTRVCGERDARAEIPRIEIRYGDQESGSGDTYGVFSKEAISTYDEIAGLVEEAFEWARPVPDRSTYSYPEERCRVDDETGERTCRTVTVTDLIPGLPNFEGQLTDEIMIGCYKGENFLNGD